MELTNSNLMRLSSWLRGGPHAVRPTAIRCITAEGAKIVAIDLTQKRPWRAAVQSILAIGAHKVEAIDKKDQVLRTFDLGELEEPDETEGEPSHAAPPMPVPTNAKESELILVATLLANAYQMGAHSHAAFADKAYDKLVAITETAFARLEGLERAWTRLLNQQVRAADGGGGGEETTPAPGGDVVQSVIAQLLPTVLARMSTAPQPTTKAAAVAAPQPTTKAAAVVNGAAQHEES